MNREVLASFSVEELQRFQSVSKKRVNDMRLLMVELQAENKKLGIEYEILVKRKKEVHNQLQQKESGLMKIYSESKKKMGGIMGIFKKEEKANHPKANQQPQTQDDKSKKKQLESQPQGKIVTMENFQFDDLYTLGKKKVQKIVKEGSHKLHQISETIMQKYNSFSKNNHSAKEQERQISQISPYSNQPAEASSLPNCNKDYT